MKLKGVVPLEKQLGLVAATATPPWPSRWLVGRLACSGPTRRRQLGSLRCARRSDRPEYRTLALSTPKKGDRCQSSLFQLLGHLGSAQVVTFNYLMLLDTLLLVEGMHNPG